MTRERAAVSGARVTLTEDLDDGLRGADSSMQTGGSGWVSPGGLERAGSRSVALLGDRAASDRMGNPDARLMHCLPASP